MSGGDEGVRACVRAALHGDVEGARALLAAEPELARRSAHVAAAMGDEAALAALLEERPSRARDPLGDGGPTPLVCASFARVGADGDAGAAARRGCVDLLLAAGARADEALTLPGRDGGHDVPVLAAAAGVRRDPELCALLLRAGADPRSPDALFAAIGGESAACVRALLEHGADATQRCPRTGVPALHRVLDVHCVPEVVELLLAHGADPDARAEPLGETALHVAARRCREHQVDPLLDAGATVDAETVGGVTPWRHAIRRGFRKVAERLAARGARTELSPSDELAVALNRSDLERARALVDAHPRLVAEMGPEEARLLPDLAGRDHHRPHCELLLDAGVDPHVRGLDGGTSLHVACWFGQPEVVELLLARGADPEDAGDDHHGTPLAWTAHGSRNGDPTGARQDRYARCAELLLAAGASLADAADPEGDPHGARLLADARPAVAEVLRRHGARERGEGPEESA